MILNQKTRTVKMTRREMLKIRMALVYVTTVCKDDNSCSEWEQILAKFGAQLDEQDKKDPDYPV